MVKAGIGVALLPRGGFEEDFYTDVPVKELNPECYIEAVIIEFIVLTNTPPEGAQFQTLYCFAVVPDTGYTFLQPSGTFRIKLLHHGEIKIRGVEHIGPPVNHKPRRKKGRQHPNP